MNKLVSVQFQDKTCNVPGMLSFSGREYTYIAGIELKEGDIVYVPTKTGEGIAKVVNEDFPESGLTDWVKPLLKTIERKYEAPADEVPAQTESETPETISMEDL